MKTKMKGIFTYQGTFLFLAIVASVSAFVSSNHQGLPYPSIPKMAFVGKNKDSMTLFATGGPEDAYSYHGEEFDDEELRQKLAEQNVHTKGYMFDVDVEPKPEDVYIILFNPDTENEGVHTIEFPKGSGNNVILAFESMTKCKQFCSMLKKQNFFLPTVQKMKLQFLESYCDSLGVRIQTIPKNMNIKPPTKTVNNLTMNPNLQDKVVFLDYLYDISTPEVEDNIHEALGSWE